MRLYRNNIHEVQCLKSRGETEVKGWVFNIQRFSVHDGPGIRTTVFLKGCPLRCVWCDNPESQPMAPQIVFWKERCIRCGACLVACPRSALVEDEGGGRKVLVERCDFCGRCLDACYTGALEQLGRCMTVEEVLEAAEADRPFYDQSGGGVTLSGGEPLAQWAFAREVLRRCKERGIHTALETCGHAPWDAWEALLPYVDLVLYDLKEVDPVKHQRFTGVDNALILENLRRLAGTGKKVVIRRPVIPGYNDSEESIHALAQVVRSLGSVDEVHLLPYHRLGQGKYERLGMEYALKDVPSLREEDVAGLRAILLAYGLRVRVGG